MKIAFWFGLTSLLLIAACGNRFEYADIYLEPEEIEYAVQASNYECLIEPDPEYSAQDLGYSSFYIVRPTTGRPRTTHNVDAGMSYRQITGTILSIEGLVTDGVIHQDVDWLKIHIESNNGEPVTLVATRWTVVPFDGFFVGKVVTAYVNANTARLVDDRLIYIASVLVINVPGGVGVYTGYFGTIEQQLERRGGSFVFYSFDSGEYDFVCSDGTIRTTNCGTVFAYNRMELLEGYKWLSNVRDGLVFIYNQPEYETNEPIAITEIHKIADSYFDWRFGWEGAEFHVPEMYSFSDFTALDMPIFLQQELLISSTPPLLHHDGVTVMVPFMSIARDWAFQFIGASVSLGDSGLMFGTSGGGSGETAKMAVGGTRASGTGLSVNFTTPTMLVDGVLYVPLIEFFAGVSPAFLTDAFIYNNEIHIIRRGWCALHGHSSRAGWGGETERQITTDVSQLPIFINGERVEAPPPLLADCGYNIMLPVRPLAEALGFTISISPCGEQARIIECIDTDTADTDTEEFFMQEERWIRIYTPFEWVDGELYAPYWCFFRDILRLGGFASESRIEIFYTGAYCAWGF